MTLRIGLIGCGHISTAHLRAWKETEGCEVTGVFDLNRELAEKQAAAFSVSTIHESIDDLLDACDVVDVCTPPQTHAKLSLDVIAAQKHLLIEKPLVTDIDDWSRIKRALETGESKLVVVHNLKYAASVRQAQNWVREGKIGRIVRIERKFLTSPATDRMLVGDAHWSHALPGGRWIETLPHELYLVHTFAGPLRVDHVTAVRTVHALPATPADEVLVALHDGSVVASMQYSASCAANIRSMTLYGTDGIITIELKSDHANLTKTGDRKWKRAVGLPYIEAGRSLAKIVPERVGYVLRRAKRESAHSQLIAAAARYFRGEGPSPTPLDEIAYVIETSHHIGRAIDDAVRTPRE